MPSFFAGVVEVEAVETIRRDEEVFEGASVGEMVKALPYFAID